MRRVVKVGGSLLLREDLLEALPQWLEKQQDAETLVIVGGGRLVDAIREVDRLRDSDPAEVHWACVDLLKTTGRMLARWFHWPFVETRPELAGHLKRGFTSCTPTVISPQTFYHCGAHIDQFSLPLDWRTTTDSIAGLLAHLAQADELVLLKSCDIDAGRTIGQLATDGIVDAAMPDIEPWLPCLRIERLR